MQFRVKKLSLAVGAALTAGMAGHALALAPAAFNSTPGDTEEVWVSGSSGQDPGLATAVARLCVAGSLDKYNDGSSQAAFFCSINTSLVPGSTKTKMVMYKSSVGGSGNGVTPLLGSGSALQFMNMNTISATPTLCPVTSVVPSVSVSGGGIVPSYNIRTCSAGTTLTGSHIPDAGLSDMEPPLFADDPAAQTLSTATKNSLVFGIAVTESLYRALQSLQGLDSTTTTADTANATDTTITRIATLPVRDNETNMPSLSRDVIGSLLNGNVLDWTTLKGPGGQSMPTVAVMGTTTTTVDPTVYVARRATTSGTQKWTQIMYFNGITDPHLTTKCYTKANPPLVSNASVDENSTNTTTECAPGGLHGTSADPVSQGSGSGDVRNCLIAHSTGGQWAIGIISTESTYSNATGAGTGNGFRFIKINGYSPSLSNVVTGKYTSWVEQALNKPSFFGGLPATAQAVVNQLYTSLGETDNIKALNASQPQPWGSGALLQLPTVVTPTAPVSGGLTQSFVLSNPVNFYSKSTGSLDNCIPAVAFPGNPITQAN